MAFEDVWFSYNGQDDRPVGLEEVRRFRRQSTYVPKEQDGEGRWR